MANPYFHFKQFTVFHDKCAMKVGFDGVTLGAWVDVAGVAGTVLDVGCGSGLIALMLAQRCDAQITAIDIDPRSVAQTRENADRSPWADRILAKEVSFQQFSETTAQKFDLIVSNPPFFINALKSAAEWRGLARHNDRLPQEDLIRGVKNLLHVAGRFCVILPVAEGALFTDKAMSEGLFCARKVVIFPNPHKPPKRLLLEFRLVEAAPCDERWLTVEKERGVFTSEYAALVKDFYLNLRSE